MPEVDGIELVQKTRENEQSSHIPIILLSAKTNLDTKIEGLDFGADSYIEKTILTRLSKSTGKQSS